MFRLSRTPNVTIQNLATPCSDSRTGSNRTKYLPDKTCLHVHQVRHMWWSVMAVISASHGNTVLKWGTTNYISVKSEILPKKLLELTLNNTLQFENALKNHKYKCFLKHRNLRHFIASDDKLHSLCTLVGLKCLENSLNRRKSLKPQEQCTSDDIQWSTKNLYPHVIKLPSTTTIYYKAVQLQEEDFKSESL